MFLPSGPKRDLGLPLTLSLFLVEWGRATKPETSQSCGLHVIEPTTPSSR